jgi:hypothetical protein
MSQSILLFSFDTIPKVATGGEEGSIEAYILARWRISVEEQQVCPGIVE